MEGASPVIVYVRHKQTCRHVDTGESYQRCNCPKWLRYSRQAKLYRLSAKTRTWSLAVEKAEALQKQLTGGFKPPPILATIQLTIEDAVQNVITAKTTEGMSPSTIRKLKFQLGEFQKFMAGRSKFFPSQIMPTDLIEYRATWSTWRSGLTRQKAQTYLRGFLKTCCKDNRVELLDVLQTIKLSKIDRKRLKAQPFTEKELNGLLAQVPLTFSDGQKRRRMTAFIHCQAATGLAIIDMIYLERENLDGGWLRINRQKTDKAVEQKLDADLVAELLSVAYDKYIFWNGDGRVEVVIGYWRDDLRQLMKDAGVWIKGNTSHRFRDTAVDYWLGQGCSMTDVAIMLGDSVAVVQRHYADLESLRVKERIEKMPTRRWGNREET